jgi:hypothetical protein
MYEYINIEKLMKTEHKPSGGLTTMVLPQSGAAVGKRNTGTVPRVILP